jgi:uncharacterized protein (TIGR02996 family)
MQHEREQLRAAIRANPDDDAPRLVLADWLEENGETDFAEFIRIEIERDRLPHDDPQREALHKHSYVLRKRGAFPGDTRNLNILSPTRRGFHAHIQAGLIGLHSGLETLGPCAARLCLLIHGNSQEEIDAREEASRGAPDRLSVAFREVFASAWVRHWIELELQYLYVSAEYVRFMVAPENLIGLKQLVFAGGLDNDAVRVLGESNLPQLRVLAIHEIPDRDEARLTPNALAILAQSPLLTQIEHLSLMGEWMGDGGLRALASSSRITALKSLNLWSRGHTPSTLQALFQSRYLAGLTRLNIPWTELDADSAALLARPEILPGLSHLEVRLARGANRVALEGRFADGLFVEDNE